MSGESRRQSTIAGGIELITQQIPAARTAAVGIWLGVGGRDETPQSAGVSHFLEHLIFKGTPTRSARDIAIATDAVGGELNGFTTKELTAYYARSPADALDGLLDVLFDVVASPRLDPDDIDSERRVILDEMRLNAELPEDRVSQRLYTSLYGEHPLGWEVAGTADTVGALAADDLAAFHRRWYRAPNMTIVATGAVDHDHIAEVAAAALSGVVDADGERPSRVVPGVPAGATHVERVELEDVHVTMAWPGPGLADEERHAMSIATQVLGGGTSSRLFQEVRERRGLAYSVYASPVRYTDAGLLAVATAAESSRLPDVMKVIDDEIASLASDGPSEHEVEVAKGAIRGSIVLALEDVWSQMARIGESMTLRGEIVEIGDFLARIDAVTAADVVEVIGASLEHEPTTVAVGPIDSLG